MRRYAAAILLVVATVLAVDILTLRETYRCTRFWFFFA